MKKSSRYLLARSILPLALLAVAGCQTTPGRPSGPLTTLQGQNLALHDGFVVEPQTLTSAFYRQMTRCTYTSVQNVPDRPPVERTVTVALRPVRDRLLITMAGDGKTSTALISADGTLHDFNFAGEEGQRWTSETYAGHAAQMVAGTRGVVINQFAAMFPAYAKAPWVVGSKVAQMRDQNGNLLAEYHYRGVTSANGRKAAMLDIMSTGAATNGKPVLIAFNVIDAETLVPLLYLYQSTAEIRLERRSCP
jgi:hypothetical protein